LLKKHRANFDALLLLSLHSEIHFFSNSLPPTAVALAYKNTPSPAEPHRESHACPIKSFGGEFHKRRAKLHEKE